ncbi:MAG: H-NS histone family protein [Methylococcales bacterium]|nr:H-NS histone family protein [Methylococcales bacterium]
MPDITNKTPEELQQIITEAQAQLEALQRENKRAVIAQIKELAASVGVTVIINESKSTDKKATVAVSAKYANPDNLSETWTGRGLPPKWMKAFTTKVDESLNHRRSSER